MKSAIIDIFKWSIIAIVTATAFYLAMPKYQLVFDNYRFNRVTGTLSHVERRFK